MDLCITAQDPFAYEPPKSKPFIPVPPATPSPHLPPSTPISILSFDLVIHDPSNDSSLTHPWDLPPSPLLVPLSTTKSQLLDLLRSHLPVKRRALRRPKLAAVTLYWTFRGAILPLGPSDEDWHYRNPITKTEMLGRSEMEWFLLKEMMASSGGALKCYFAIRGETPPPPIKKMIISGKWFRGRQ